MEEMKSTGKEETDADQLEQILPKEIQNWDYVESYLLREDQGQMSGYRESYNSLHLRIIRKWRHTLWGGCTDHYPPTTLADNVIVSGSRSSLYHANYCDVQMDELSLEKAYSIEYYKRLFYPEIPCKQCEHCWRKGY